MRRAIVLLRGVAPLGETHAMTIELSKPDREQLIASIQRYFEEQMDEHQKGDRLGNIAAGALLGFFLEELGPLVYNRAVADVQERLRQRVAEVDLEVNEDEFQYWRKQGGAGRRR